MLLREVNEFGRSVVHVEVLCPQTLALTATPDPPAECHICVTEL